MKSLVFIFLSLILSISKSNNDLNNGMLRANLLGTGIDKSISIQLKYYEFNDDGKFKIIKDDKETKFNPLLFISKNPYIHDDDFFKSIEFKCNNCYYKITPNNINFIKKKCITEDGLSMVVCEGFSFDGILTIKDNKKETKIKMNFIIEQGI